LWWRLALTRMHAGQALLRELADVREREKEREEKRAAEVEAEREARERDRQLLLSELEERERLRLERQQDREARQREREREEQGRRQPLSPGLRSWPEEEAEAEGEGVSRSLVSLSQACPELDAAQAGSHAAAPAPRAALFPAKAPEDDKAAADAPGRSRCLEPHPPSKSVSPPAASRGSRQVLSLRPACCLLVCWCGGGGAAGCRMLSEGDAASSY
jgi:hypothetical protein